VHCKEKAERYEVVKLVIMLDAIGSVVLKVILLKSHGPATDNHSFIFKLCHTAIIVFCYTEHRVV